MQALQAAGTEPCLLPDLALLRFPRQALRKSVLVDANPSPVWV